MKKVLLFMILTMLIILFRFFKKFLTYENHGLGDNHIGELTHIRLLTEKTYFEIEKKNKKNFEVMNKIFWVLKLSKIYKD